VRVVVGVIRLGLGDGNLAFGDSVTLVTFWCLIRSYGGGALHKAGWTASFRSGEPLVVLTRGP